MADMEFTLTGAAELQRALDSLPQKLEAHVLRDMMLLGARDLRDDFKAVAPLQEQNPKGGGHPQGTGREAIQATAAHADKQPAAYVVLRPQGFFLIYYEFGDSRQPARPFMRPLIGTNSSAVLEEMIALGQERFDEAVNEAKA